MTDLDNTHDAARLYRRYQETRDTISPSVLNALREKVEQERHEESIYAITQMSKVASGSSKPPATKNTKPSWFAGIISKYSRVSPQFGMLAACLAVVAIVLPIGLNLNNNQTAFTSTSHLSDCAACANYIANASVGTRGANARGLSVEQKKSARLGKLSGKLAVLAAINIDLAVESGINDLSKLPKSMLSAELVALTQTSNVKLSNLDKALREASTDQTTYKASQALLIANVTARRAVDTGDTAGLNTSISNVLSTVQDVPNLSLSQKGQIRDLKHYLDGKEADQALIEKLKLMSSSIGG